VILSVDLVSPDRITISSFSSENNSVWEFPVWENSIHLPHGDEGGGTPEPASGIAHLWWQSDISKAADKKNLFVDFSKKLVRIKSTGMKPGLVTKIFCGSVNWG